MSTKAALGTLIDTDLASDQPIIATQHRNVLKDDVSSVLNNIYDTEVIDTDVTQTFFTLSNPGFIEFTFFLLKQGTSITLTGTLIAITSSLSLIGSFNTGVYQSSANINYFGVGIKFGTTEISGVNISNFGGVTNLRLKNALFTGEILNFSITYNSIS